MQENQPFEAASPPMACTTTKCTSREDEDRLQCRKCKRYVHYECTQLPLYQLQIFVNTYNDQYTCPNCVRITRSLTNKAGKNTCHMMQRELENKNDVIEKLPKELNKLNNKSDNNENIKNELENLLIDKIADLEAKTREIIREEIKETKDSMQQSSQATYAEITKAQRKSLKSVVKEQKEEDMREERDIESRKRNIIIHGIMELSHDTPEKDQEEDKSNIEMILADIDISDIKFSHHRIGIKHPEEKVKQRPIKVTFESLNDKERIMKSLGKLKRYEYYRRLSITDDFTINERKKIKEMNDKAKKMNSGNEGDLIDFKWSVCGVLGLSYVSSKNFRKHKKIFNCKPQSTTEEVRTT